MREYYGGVVFSHLSCILEAMQEILFGYRLNPTTWAYISTLMLVGIYFKFQRFWSVRNLDLIGLIAFAPGFLLIYHGLVRHWPDLMAAWGMAPPSAQNPDLSKHLIQAGYTWLFAVSAFFLVRLLLDAVMVRRPLLEPNLSSGGLTFTCASLLIFLMANVITCPQQRLEYLLAKQAAPAPPAPGCPWFDEFSNFSNEVMIHQAAPPAAGKTGGTPSEARRTAMLHAAATHAVAIMAHLAVVAGLVWIGFRHFGNIQTGIAAATLYLLTFYTSQLTSQVDHVVPGMLLVWTAAAYRRPVFAGILMGLAAGLIFYPLFLLPLWCAFYWRRGLVRFVFGVVLALGLMTALLAWTAPDTAQFVAQAQQMFGLRNPLPIKPTGFWNSYPDQADFRIPVIAMFMVISAGLAIWPAHKNFGTLLSCSAAVMLAAQFWHADQGGLYMGWYLPLLILTILRPNLEDRVALSAVRPLRRRKA